MSIPILNSSHILDPSRVRRPGRCIEWRVSWKVRQRFRELLHELVELEYANQRDSGVLQRMEGLRDAIRHLPGYPRRYNPERDTIVPITTTVSR